MRMATLLLTLVIGTIQGQSAFADSWKSSDGKFTIQAVYVSYSEGMVTLRKTDGEEITLPIFKLHLDSQLMVIEKAIAQVKAVEQPVAQEDAPQAPADQDKPKEQERFEGYIEVSGVFGPFKLSHNHRRGEFETQEEFETRINKIAGTNIYIGRCRLDRYDIDQGIYHLVFHYGYSPSDELALDRHVSFGDCVLRLGRDEARSLKEKIRTLKVFATFHLVKGKFIIKDPYIQHGRDKMKLYRPERED